MYDRRVLLIDLPFNEDSVKMAAVLDVERAATCMQIRGAYRR